VVASWSYLRRVSYTRFPQPLDIERILFDLTFILLHSVSFGGDWGLARRARRLRPFERAECRVCSLKGSAYCWRQCPYNVWRQRRIE
jgi:hypothetical protein